MPAPGLLRGVDRAAFAVAFAARLRAAGRAGRADRGRGVHPRRWARRRSAPGASCTGWRARRWCAGTPSWRSSTPSSPRCSTTRPSSSTRTAPHAPPARARRSGRRVGAQRRRPTAGTRPAAGCPGSRCRPWSTPPTSPATGQPIPHRAAQRAGGAGRRAVRRARRAGSWPRSAAGSRPRCRTGRRAAAGAAGCTRPGTGRAARHAGPGPAHRLGAGRAGAHPARRPGTARVVMLCDVSRSMQPTTTAVPAPDAGRRGAHADRGVRVRHPADPADPGARAPLGPSAPCELATDRVTDRFGGTRIASSIDALLRSRHGHRGARRPPWSSPPTAGTPTRPADLDRAMARLRRRAHAVHLGQPAGWPRPATRRWSAGWPRRCRTATGCCPGTACARCSR